MSYRKPLFIRIVLLIWAVYTMAAPPGLPACWLEKEPCEFHTHFIQEQAETPHSHFYLYDLTLGMASQPYPFVFLASSMLLLLLSLSGAKFRQLRGSSTPLPAGWESTPEPPPPKATPASLPLFFC